MTIRVLGSAFGGLVCLAALGVGTMGARAAEPALEYFVYVASEAADRIALIRFGPDGARVERDFATGVMPTAMDGPHGLAVSPRGDSYYVSLAHGQPFGMVLKY